MLIHLDSACVVDDTGCARNLELCLARGLSLCEPLPERAGQLAVVGAGPSVRDYLDELRTWPGEIWATNGAYEWLLEQDIVPHGFLGLDPLPGLAEYVRKARKETTFYISGMCAPEMFDALEGFDIRVWFPKQMGVPFRPGLWLVPGGTTALTRAPGLAKMLGWRDVTIYGADSSFDTERYAYGKRFKEDSPSEGTRVFLMTGEGPFYSDQALLKQASQFGVLAQTKAINLKFRCGGLLGAYLRAPTEDEDLHDEYNRRAAAEQA